MVNESQNDYQSSAKLYKIELLSPVTIQQQLAHKKCAYLLQDSLQHKLVGNNKTWKEKRGRNSWKPFHAKHNKFNITCSIISSKSL